MERPSLVTPLHLLAQRLVALDDPAGTPGAEDRRTINLRKIINHASNALIEQEAHYEEEIEYGVLFYDRLNEIYRPIWYSDRKTAELISRESILLDREWNLIRRVHFSSHYEIINIEDINNIDNSPQTF